FAHFGEKLMRKIRRFGGHSVRGIHSAERAQPFVATRFSGKSDRFYRDQHHKSLPGVVVEFVFSQLSNKNIVRVLDGGDALWRDFAKDTDGETGPWERVTADGFFGQAELATKLAHFIFEEFAQRLDEFEMHIFGQAPDVVVRFDSDFFAADFHAFYDIWVERTLGQEARVGDAAGNVFENADKLFADDLPLAFGLFHAFQFGQESFGRVDDAQVHVKMLTDHVFDVLA